MKYMKELTRILALIMAGILILSSCSDDKDDNGFLRFSVPAVYFSESMTHSTVTFESRDIVKYYLSQKPAGWDKYIVLNEAEHTLSISLPDELKHRSEDDKPVEVAPSGEIILAGVGASGIVKSATLFVGLLPTTDLSDKPANSYIVCEKNTHYTFPAAKPDGTPVEADRVDVVWQDHAEFMTHLGLTDKGMVSFFMPEDPNDKEYIREGNAVIGAYDKDNNLVWSWHVWASRTNPEQNTLRYANGCEMMDRNLGALANSTETASDRIKSYGLYYQWGRRTPFAGPLDYIFTSGVYAFIYNSLGHRVYQSYEECSAEKGTRDYADRHPLTFITSTDKQNGHDWMHTPDDRAWDTEKTVNDPCPFGWKVAPISSFEGLAPTGTPEKNAYELYGLKITDGATTSLWMGGGRILYNSGRFQNIYIPDSDTRNIAQEAQPWEGLYWSCDAGTDRKARAFRFWYEKATDSYGSNCDAPYQRANAMNIRCVRDDR